MSSTCCSYQFHAVNAVTIKCPSSWAQLVAVDSTRYGLVRLARPQDDAQTVIKRSRQRMCVYYARVCSRRPAAAVCLCEVVLLSRPVQISGVPINSACRIKLALNGAQRRRRLGDTIFCRSAGHLLNILPRAGCDDTIRYDG